MSPSSLTTKHLLDHPGSWLQACVGKIGCLQSPESLGVSTSHCLPSSQKGFRSTKQWQQCSLLPLPPVQPAQFSSLIKLPSLLLFRGSQWPVDSWLVLAATLPLQPPSSSPGSQLQGGSMPNRPTRAALLPDSRSRVGTVPAVTLQALWQRLLKGD